MRDTDADWQHYGDTNPYFGVLTDPRFLDPDEDALQAFFGGGETEIAHLHAVIERHLGSFAPRSALDFGCGVGRLAIPLARLSGNALGIDISDGMLSLAQKHAAQVAAPLRLGKDIPADEQFDWVNSIIVLQHIPPRRGYGIIGRLWRAVSAGGVLSLQITIYKDARHTPEVVRDLRVFRNDGEILVDYSEDHRSDTGDAGVMTMYDYDLSRVFAILNLPDSTGVYLESTDHGGCHGFRIYVRKP